LSPDRQSSSFFGAITSMADFLSDLARLWTPDVKPRLMAIFLKSTGDISSFGESSGELLADSGLSLLPCPTKVMRYGWKLCWLMESLLGYLSSQLVSTLLLRGENNLDFGFGVGPDYPVLRPDLDLGTLT